MTLLQFLLPLFVFANTSVKAQLTLDSEKKNMTVVWAGRTTQVPLKFPSEMELKGEPVFYGVEDFGLIVASLSDGETGTSIVYAIDRNGKLLWTKDLGGFNPSQPLIEKSHVYLGCIGKVLKVERKTGNVVWEHDNLYSNKKFKFNGAEPVVRRGDVIIYSDTVQVKDATGKFTEVQL